MCAQVRGRHQVLCDGSCSRARGPIIIGPAHERAWVSWGGGRGERTGHRVSDTDGRADRDPGGPRPPSRGEGRRRPVRRRGPRLQLLRRDRRRRRHPRELARPPALGRGAPGTAVLRRRRHADRPRRARDGARRRGRRGAGAEPVDAARGRRRGPGSGGSHHQGLPDAALAAAERRLRRGEDHRLALLGRRRTACATSRPATRFRSPGSISRAIRRPRRSCASSAFRHRTRRS